MKKKRQDKKPISLRVYLRFARPYRLLAAAFLAVSMLGLAVNLAQANLLGRLIDTALKRSGDSISRIAVLRITSYNVCYTKLLRCVAQLHDCFRRSDVQEKVI